MIVESFYVVMQLIQGNTSEAVVRSKVEFI